MAILVPTRLVVWALVAVMVLGSAPRTWAASPEEIEQKLKSLEEQVSLLRRQLEDTKAATPPAPAPATAAPAPAPDPVIAPAAPPAAAPTTVSAEAPSLLASLKPSWLSDFKIGGYGSTRYEASSLPQVPDSFTFRRFVLSGDATIADRIRSVVEIEFEHFTELEVERTTTAENGFQGFSQSIEGSNNSELSLEQAWVQLYLADWLKFRMGNVLVPVGRFNINHDDNKWDIARRSLVDRGTPVLPTTAAWSEVGLGLNGEIDLKGAGKLTYEVYVMNGVSLDSSIETVARGSGELEAEVELTARRGPANLDVKSAKAGAMRVAWSPTLGSEIGMSGYYGRYTPDFLPSENLWAVSADGKLLVDLWRRAARRRRRPSATALADALARAGSSSALAIAGARVSLPRAGSSIDLDAIAKGVALDRVAVRLRRWGVPALLNFGESSVVAVGSDPGHRWTLLLRHPFGGFVGMLDPGNRACSTSATGGERRRDGESGGAAVVVDPRTGRRVERSAQVTVLAVAATVAEAASTALLVLGRDAVDEIAARLAVDVCWIDRAGTYVTRDFALDRASRGLAKTRFRAHEAGARDESAAYPFA